MLCLIEVEHDDVQQQHERPEEVVARRLGARQLAVQARRARALLARQRGRQHHRVAAVLTPETRQRARTKQSCAAPLYGAPCIRQDMLPLGTL